MMNPTANWSLIPEHLRSSVEGYIEYSEHPGDFLAAVASNDLFRAAQLADKTNRARLADIADFFRLHAPHECSGSKANFKAWIVSAGSC